MSLTDTRVNPISERMPAGLLARIVAHLNPVRVIVFGSQATGRVHNDSDWDILVVVDDDLPAEQISWRGIGQVRHGVRGAIDLIPLRESTYLDRIDIIGSLPWTATKNGLVVYERAGR